MLVRYRGFRPEHRDALYGTGDWAAGQVKDVPDDAGHKLLRHPDVFARVGKLKDKEPVEKVKSLEDADARKDEEEARLQSARLAIDAMTRKDDVADFVRDNFRGHKLSKEHSLTRMKQEAVMLIDQYGLP